MFGGAHVWYELKRYKHAKLTIMNPTYPTYAEFFLKLSRFVKGDRDEILEKKS